MDITRMPIGFFDSGVGGLSVLKEAIKILPNEDFIYFGDSKNAPYGTKKVDEVKKLTFDAVKMLLDYNVKAIVVACNTATSAAIEDLRNTYKYIPIIGIEPALKPAVELSKDGKIVIMATNMTLAEKKFNKLMSKYKGEYDIVSLPCPGLVEYIEKGIVEGKKLNEFLIEKLSILDKDKIASIVLGCTHYPFIKKELSNILGDEVVIIDGSFGTASQLKRKLIKNNSINRDNKKGKITILNSSEDEEIIKVSKKLLGI
ncbi:glutamate racemase [Clostridium botulinum]|uniref:Glutamate racemase n=1 Tax=Clostridium botulinum C/D str. DC5 TaxID=1443128 RepID=A0A0A0IQJ0_CLOBO|nr:glutamate racemase [Clostridium botulinum]KGN01751.1 glutamate racemase [Clostridium botulinum C/D str. DC5]KOC54376.1 glutamate racemase [Clostridium botulinum]KOC58357.1 glutamate racemase [Clostridium botulinum]MCD3234992.1 glutamate racemase [Clostridium botulinum D/C]MCD3240870.1 glutamate racemase [Clostridium botulinum D/C]